MILWSQGELIITVMPLQIVEIKKKKVDGMDAWELEMFFFSQKQLANHKGASKVVQ